MNSIVTSNTHLMQVKDHCVFVTNAMMTDDNHLTVGKAYAGIIENVQPDYQVHCLIQNDIGIISKHRVLYDNFSIGMCTVEVILTPEDYTSRVSAHHAENVEKMVERIRIELDNLDKHKAKLMEAVNAPAPV